MIEILYFVLGTIFGIIVIGIINALSPTKVNEDDKHE